VPRFGSSYSRRAPRSRSTSETASRSRTAALVEELGDRRRVRQRRQQLDRGTRVADREHRLPDALLLVDLLVRHGHAEHVGVVPDGLVEVGHRDADVVDRVEQLIHAASVA
jgi:hypothetical protein